MKGNPADTKERKKKDPIPVNYRPVLLAAVSLAVGIFSCFLLESGKTSSLLFCLAFPALFFLLLFLCCRFIAPGRGRALLVDFAVAAALFAVGFAWYSVSAYHVRSGERESGRYLVRGEVVSVSVKEGYKSIIVDSCTYDGVKGGRISVRTASDVSLYDEVEWVASVSPARKNENLRDYYLNARVSLVSDGTPAVTVTGRGKSLPAKVNGFLKGVFGAEDCGGVAVAMLSGDLSGVDYETLESYRLTGIAHVFAVSGMHVGLLFAALSFLLNKIPVRRSLRCLAITAVLFFYSYLCGATPSSLRAAVMCSVLAWSRALGEKPDSLNAFGLSAIVALLIDPTDLFSVGFRLSYAVCFALVVLSPCLKRRLSFLPDAFSSALSATLAAELFSLPLVVSSFGSFNFLSLIVNLAVLPVISLLYYGLWVALLFYVILPVYRLIGVQFVCFLFGGVNSVLRATGSFSVSLSYFPAWGYLPFYACLVGASDVVNLSEKKKNVLLVLAFSFFFALGAFFAVRGQVFA